MMSASAILYISSSVPSRLKLLTAHKTILQLFFTYPLVGSILSTLGEKCVFLYPFLLVNSEKGSWVNSQNPVQRSRIHEASKLNCIPSVFALALVPFKTECHGSVARRCCV